MTASSTFASQNLPFELVECEATYRIAEVSGKKSPFVDGLDTGALALVQSSPRTVSEEIGCEHVPPLSCGLQDQDFS